MNKNKKLLLLLLLALMTGGYASAQRKPDSDQLLKQIRIEMDVKKDYRKALELCKKGLDAYPGDMDYQFLVSRLYLLNNDPDNAQKHAEIVLRKSPEYKDAYLIAANAQLAKRNNLGALRYLDKGLQRFPRDRDMRLKKMVVYQSVNLYADAERQADTVLYFFSKDPYAVTEYINYHVTAGQYFLKQGNSLMATRHFDKVLEMDPKNKEALEGSLSLKSQSGDENSSLIMINKSLLTQPNNYELLMKKIGMLQDMKRYPEAIETLQVLLKTYPADAKARQMDVDLKLEAARYYKSTDPYYQYQSVLEKSPGNREALDNVINIAISRGLTQDALYWINRSLEHGAADKDLLRKKMSLLQQQQKNIEAAAIAERLLRLSPGDRAFREEYLEMQLVAGRDFAAQQLPDSALWAYNKVLSADPRNEQALNSSINILAGRKDYDGALQLVDKAMGYYPNDLNLAVKKAGILLDNEQYEDAMLYLESLNTRYPGNTRISGSLIEAYMSVGRRMMAAGNYTEALTAFNKALELQPRNKEALNSSINIELANPDVNYETTLTKVEGALEAYPNDKDLLLKKAEILMRLHRYEEAYGITDTLRKKYPYNANVRDAYTDQLLIAAAEMRGKGDTTGAITLYNQVLDAKASDTVALLGLYNVYNADSNFGQALATANRALEKNPGNTTFMLKRASALESMSRFQEAALAADTVARRFPDMKRYQDYLAYLKGKTFKNQLGVSFLNSRYDSAQSANIATFQYTRFIKRGTITARLNFAGRSIGTGLQGELESYYNHTKDKKWYSYIVLGAGNAVVFPKYKVNYSLFHSFKHGWEAEIGGRYLNFDTLTSVSGVASLARYFGDFWLNLRGYTTFVSDNQYFAANLTLRQYLLNKTDFFYTTFGYGNTPDDFSRAFQLGNIISFTTYSIGGGYQRVFNYRNTLSINGTWFNQHIDQNRYRNQYDIYITFFRRF